MVFLQCTLNTSIFKSIKPEDFKLRVFIQEDLEFARVGGQKRLMGAVSLGQSYEDVRSLTEGLRDSYTL